MGSMLSYTRVPEYLPSHVPQTNSKPTFDAQFGFKAPRKIREAKYGEEELKAMRFDQENRDYCSHTLADLVTCMHRKYPLFILCNKEHHKHKSCEYNDYLLRMKEFEREKRLRIREQKLKEATVS